MSELLNNDGFMVLVGTLFGGVGLKLIETWLGRAKERVTEARFMREELRSEIDRLRDQLARADEEEARLDALVEDWRAKSYDLRDENRKLVTELTITLDKLKELEARMDNQRDQ